MAQIKKETLTFLSKLKKNNDRDWFNANKQLYVDAHANIVEFVADLINKIAVFDKTVVGLEPKKCVFRIYRDTRFSKDKTPYKVNLGANITGIDKRGKSGYYLHIQPGDCFLAGGVYMPEPERLKLIREDISMEGEKFLKIISDKTFKKNFKELSGDKLKTVPKGFDKEDPMLKYLQLKNLVMYHEVKDEVALSAKFAAYCANIFKSMMPMNEFLNASIE